MAVKKLVINLNRLTKRRGSNVLQVEYLDLTNDQEETRVCLPGTKLENHFRVPIETIIFCLQGALLRREDLNEEKYAKCKGDKYLDQRSVLVSNLSNRRYYCGFSKKNRVIKK